MAGSWHGSRQPTMITVAPTGAESSKADVPALPVTLRRAGGEREGL